MHDFLVQKKRQQFYPSGVLYRTSGTPAMPDHLLPACGKDRRKRARVFLSALMVTILAQVQLLRDFLCLHDNKARLARQLNHYNQGHQNLLFVEKTNPHTRNGGTERQQRAKTHVRNVPLANKTYNKRGTGKRHGLVGRPRRHTNETGRAASEYTKDWNNLVSHPSGSPKAPGIYYTWGLRFCLSL